VRHRDDAHSDPTTSADAKVTQVFEHHYAVSLERVGEVALRSAAKASAAAVSDLNFVTSHSVPSVCGSGPAELNHVTTSITLSGVKRSRRSSQRNCGVG